jgi:hypothetical protein
MKTDVNVPLKNNKQNIFEKKNYFLSASSQPLMKNAYEISTVRYGNESTRCPPWMDSWHSCVRRADADRRPGAERRGRTAAEAGGGRVRMAATGGGRVRTAATGGGGCGEGSGGGRGRLVRPLRQPQVLQLGQNIAEVSSQIVRQGRCQRGQK